MAQNTAGSIDPDRALSPADLRLRRRAIGATQSALAAALGVTPTTVARWERGEQTIGNPEMLKLALERLSTTSSVRPRRTQSAASHTNLPYQLSSFVGRSRDVLEVRRILGEVRLVTITGPGGMGKTRLALEAGAGLTGKYSDGVWFAELAPVSEPGLVALAVARVVRVKDVGAQIIQPGWG